VTELRFERTNPGTIANLLFFSWFFARRGPKRRGAVNLARFRSPSRLPRHPHNVHDSRELHAKILPSLGHSETSSGSIDASPRRCLTSLPLALQKWRPSCTWPAEKYSRPPRVIARCYQKFLCARAASWRELLGCYPSVPPLSFSLFFLSFSLLFHFYARFFAACNGVRVVDDAPDGVFSPPFFFYSFTESPL